MPIVSQACSTVVPFGTSTSCPSMVSLAMVLLRRLARRDRAIFGDAALHPRAEMADEALHRPDRAIGQRTDRVAFDLGGHFLQQIKILDRRITLDHALHHAPHPAQPLAARRA